MANKNSETQNRKRTEGSQQRVVMKRVFELIEAMEAEPHIGMTDSRKLWDAYTNLTRSLGGSPMSEWWKGKKLHNSELTNSEQQTKG